MKIMASGSITSWEIDGETVETVSDFIFLWRRLREAQKDESDVPKEQGAKPETLRHCPGFPLQSVKDRPVLPFTQPLTPLCRAPLKRQALVSPLCQAQKPCRYQVVAGAQGGREPPNRGHPKIPRILQIQPPPGLHFFSNQTNKRFVSTLPGSKGHFFLR